MKPQQDWGVPDWTCEIQYQLPPRSEPLLFWAWQFLRRNHEYRKFWIENVVPIIDEDGQWLDEPYGIGHILDEAQSEFGLAVPHEPTMNRGAYFAASGNHQLRYIKNNNGLCNVSMQEYEVGFIFDMSLTLESQFERALEAAKLLQERRKQQGVLRFKNTKVRTDKYIMYLRILDADDAGASSDKIGEALFPLIRNEYPEYRRTAALRDYRKAAKRLRDHDYRLLANGFV